MIKITIKDTRSCSIKTYGERVRKGDNRIASLLIEMPECFGEYNRGSCSVAMKCHVTEGVITYNLRTDSSTALVPITTDITDRKQVVRIDFVITHSGNVIGTTNTVKLEVLDAPDNGEPLTPRAEADEKIREQQETITEQAETITEQEETIGSQGEQITELSGEVAELQGEVAEKQATITRQNTTIDELNRRVPPLQTLDPINPTTEQVTYNPESPNIGFSQVIVNAPTAERLGFREDYYKKDEIFLNKVGTYDPFPEHSVGGIYITEVNENGFPAVFLIKNLVKGFLNTFQRDWDQTIYIEKILFDNCPAIEYFPTNSSLLFNGATGLIEARLPHTLKRLSNYEFNGCRYLKIINIPSSLTSIGLYNVFGSCESLEYVTIENGFNCNNLSLSSSTLYSHDTILSWFNALVDRTGETAYTLTIGATNLNKMSAEEKAIATNKNWNLA